MKRRFIAITFILAVTLVGCGQIDEPTISAKNNKDNPNAAQTEVHTDVRTEETVTSEIIYIENQTTIEATSEDMTNNISTTEEFPMKEENEKTIFEDNDMPETDTPVVDIIETKSDDISKVTIFNRLSSLNYIPITCDGLPEYKLTTDDETIYWLNFSSKWIWKNGVDAEAVLPDDIITWLKENIKELNLEEAY